MPERHRHRSAARLIASVVAVTVATFGVVKLAVLQLHGGPVLDLLAEAAGLSLSTGALLWFAVVRPLREDAERERALNRLREQELQTQADQQAFESRLHRALEMADSEAGSYTVVQRALERGVNRLPAELLLADSSDAHLKRTVAHVRDGLVAQCSVQSPRDCPAIRRAQTLTFDSPKEIDACPHIIDRLPDDVAATCVPVSVGGRSIGVMHSVAPREHPATPGEVLRLEAVATQSGARIGLLRVMESTHLQAATDPLTGLLNRRSFENQAQDLLGRSTPFALAMADLDHFKKINDAHGHDAGDRALRLFARVLRRSLRADDLVSRYGGEEFVIAFPNLPIEQAAAALRRVQEELLVALSSGTVPAFTASFGLSCSQTASSLEELARAADSALFRAKRAGRNRVVVDSPSDDLAGDDLVAESTA